MFAAKRHGLRAKPAWIVAIKRMNYFVFSAICRTFAAALIHEMKMKHLTVCISIVLFMGSLVGCGGKKDNGDIITKKPVLVVHRTIQKTGDYVQRREVSWLGSHYTVEVKRMADPSLPVINEGSSRYYDNRITITVIRSDGSKFFSRSFTKKDFLAYVDKAYADEALVGIVLDHAEGDHLRFAASVGSPDKLSDEYVPLKMTLSRTGGVSISRDTQLDTGSSEPSEADLSDEESI